MLFGSSYFQRFQWTVKIGPKGLKTKNIYIILHDNKNMKAMVLFIKKTENCMSFNVVSQYRQHDLIAIGRS